MAIAEVFLPFFKGTIDKTSWLFWFVLGERKVSGSKNLVAILLSFFPNSNLAPAPPAIFGICLIKSGYWSINPASGLASKKSR